MPLHTPVPASRNSDKNWSVIGSYLPPHDLLDLALKCRRLGKGKVDVVDVINYSDHTERSLMEDVA